MDWTGIVPFGMDRRPDSPQTFAGFKCDSVDVNVCQSSDEKMELKHDHISVDSFLGLGMENMGISSKMDEFSLGLDFSFLPDVYGGGLDPWRKQDGEEAGLKPEILDGFLDEVEEVEHIYASHHPSSTANHFLPETQVKKKASELDGEPYGLMNFSSESYSPSGRSIELSEWSKETTVPHAESSGNVKDGFATTYSNEIHCVYESEDDRKPLSTLLGSWVGRGRRRNKILLNTRCSRLDSFSETKSCVSYDFRPRKEPLENYIHHTTESTLSSDDPITSSEREDDISVSTIKSKGRSDRRKQQRMWTIDEVVKLLDGISHFGLGKWTDIKNFFFHSSSHRTPVDIRDKWRNLLKASYNNKHNGDAETEEKRRSAARIIPKDILHRVRELASLHSKSLCFVHGSSRSPSTSRKKKKKQKKWS